MYRIALLCLFTLLAPRPAHAQVLLALLVGKAVHGDNFHVGLNFSGSLTTLSSVDGRVSFGPHIALISEYRFKDHWYLFNEIAMTSVWGIKDADPTAFGAPPFEVPPDLANSTVSRKLNYVGLPAIIKFAPGKKYVHFGLGGRLMIRTGSRDIWTNTSNEDVEVHNLTRGKISPVDAGPEAMIEVKFGTDPWAMSFTLRGYHGFVSVEPDAPTRMWNRGITGGVVIPLGRPATCPSCEEAEPTPTASPVEPAPAAIEPEEATPAEAEPEAAPEGQSEESEPEGSPDPATP